MPLAFSGTVASVAPPSLKVTLPVGVAPGPLTVAAKVTGLPTVPGLVELVSLTVLAARFTVRLSEPVLVRYAPLPE